MQIVATTTFLDDRTRYEKGKTYDVDDAHGAYFVACGWAQGPDGYTGPGTNQHVRLDIQSGSLGHTADDVTPEG